MLGPSWAVLGPSCSVFGAGLGRIWFVFGPHLGPDLVSGLETYYSGLGGKLTALTLFPQLVLPGTNWDQMGPTGANGGQLGANWILRQLPATSGRFELVKAKFSCFILVKKVP